MNDEILKRIDALEAKLGVAATHIWAFYVSHAYVEAFTNLIWALVMGFITFMLAWSCIHHYRKAENPERLNYRNDCAEGVTITCGIGTIIFGIITLVALSFCIEGFFAPEFAAFTRLLRDIKQ